VLHVAIEGLSSKNPQSWRRSAMQRVVQFMKNEDGHAVTEYGLLLALVAVAVIAVGKAFRDQLKSIFTTATSSLAAP
jgi:Flp pilus assembly pilin Flp